MSQYECHLLDLEKTGVLNPLILNYLNQNPSLEAFYDFKPQLESFSKQIELKSKDKNINRNILADVLIEQYSFEGVNQNVLSNIISLKDCNTFTITTGHQLCLATGPLYCIYKVMTCISAAKKLKSVYPNYHFVPVFWMASEDHDLNEANHFYLFGQKREWQTNQTGAVGRMKTENMAQVLNAIPDLPAFVKESYAQAKNMAEATKFLFHFLFGNQGLVCLDADHIKLKTLFLPLMKSEIANSWVQAPVEESSLALQNLGFKTQAKAQEINLFYLQNQSRERIEKIENGFQIKNTELLFLGENALENMVCTPENLSPNVMMRPMYQEFILPNLAYIGGPGELAYWLQLKKAFIIAEIPFPILLDRCHSLFIPKNILKKWNSFSFEWKDLFLSEKELVYNYLLTSNPDLKEIHYQTQLLSLQNLIEEKAIIIDKSLIGNIKSEFKQIEKTLIEIEKKIKKSLEKKEESQIEQIKNIKAKLFPNENFQERHDNILSFLINDPDFLEKIFPFLDPFNNKFSIIHEKLE